MDGEATDESIFKSLVIIHLDKFVQINAIQIKNTAEMVSENEIIAEFDDAFDIIWITLFEK